MIIGKTQGIEIGKLYKDFLNKIQKKTKTKKERKIN